MTEESDEVPRHDGWNEEGYINCHFLSHFSVKIDFRVFVGGENNDQGSQHFECLLKKRVDL
jgi:hypothetical protein